VIKWIGLLRVPEEEKVAFYCKVFLADVPFAKSSSQWEAGAGG
jgi:hypothetical protein